MQSLQKVWPHGGMTASIKISRHTGHVASSLIFDIVFVCDLCGARSSIAVFRRCSRALRRSAMSTTTIIKEEYGQSTTLYANNGGDVDEQSGSEEQGLLSVPLGKVTIQPCVHTCVLVRAWWRCQLKRSGRSDTAWRLMRLQSRSRGRRTQRGLKSSSV